MNPAKLFQVCVAMLLLASCQDASDPYMTLETKILPFGQEGGTKTVILSSNVYFRVNNDCHDSEGHYWARIVDTSVDADVSAITLQVDENPSVDVRTGTIRFIGDHVTPLKLTVSQEGVVPEGIDPVSASVKYSETQSVFKVYGQGQWTAVCEDPEVTLSPSSGFGDSDVTVSFPENTDLKEKTTTVKVDIEGDGIYTYTLVRGKYTGIIADWDLNGMAESTAATFVDSEDQTEFPGTNGKFIEASAGSGRIEYWACDRTGYPAKDYVCLRQIGGNGDPYVSGAIPGDYWHITADHMGKTIPAGTGIHFYFVTKFGTACSGYWMIEYKEGDEWKPALETASRMESATSGLSGNPVSYSEEITYNFAGLLLDSKNNGAYMAVEGTFVTSEDMNSIEMRFRQAGHLCLDGTKNDGLYIDQTQSGGQTRFSAQRPSEADGTAVRIYDQHVTIDFTE